MSIYAKAANPEQTVQQLHEIYLKSYAYEVQLSPASHVNCFYSFWGEKGRQIKISRRDILPIQSDGLFLNHCLRDCYCHCNANMLFRSLLFRAAYAEHSKGRSLQAAWMCWGCHLPGPSCLITGLNWGEVAPTAHRSWPGHSPTNSSCLLIDVSNLHATANV